MPIGNRLGAYSSSTIQFPDPVGLARAWSFNYQLIDGYSGNGFRVREDGGNTEQNIGFLANGRIDEASLTSFVGLNNGFVVRLFDQTGSGVNPQQLTFGNQPQIVTTGVVNKNPNGDIYADTLNGTRFLLSTLGTVTQPGAVFEVLHRQSQVGVDTDVVHSRGGDAPNIWTLTYLVNYVFGAGANLVGGPVDTIQHLFSVLVDGLNGAFYIDSTLKDSGDVGTRVWAGIALGAVLTGAFSADIHIFELLVYDSDKSSTRSAIESNINSRYNIF